MKYVQFLVHKLGPFIINIRDAIKKHVDLLCYYNSSAKMVIHKNNTVDQLTSNLVGIV